jgi:hypothetical protein
MRLERAVKDFISCAVPLQAPSSQTKVSGMRAGDDEYPHVSDLGPPPYQMTANNRGSPGAENLASGRSKGQTKSTDASLFVKGSDIIEMDGEKYFPIVEPTGERSWIHMRSNDRIRQPRPDVLNLDGNQYVQVMSNLKNYSTLSECDPNAVTSLFDDWGLGQLRAFAKIEEDAANATEQAAATLSRLYYFIFLHTRSIPDILKAIQKAEQLLEVTSPGDQSYRRYLKDLVVMLVKCYFETNSVDDLLKAINRAQEMLGNTNADDPVHPSLFDDLMAMMLRKQSHTKSKEDFEDVKSMIRQFGGDPIIQELDNRGTLSLHTGMPPARYTRCNPTYDRRLTKAQCC